MPNNNIDQGITWSLKQLDNLRFMRAEFVHHAFKAHAHDYFVIGLIEAGVQSFTHGRKHIITTPGKLIVINPDEVHTGEAAIERGFVYRALYPTQTLMDSITAQFSQQSVHIPSFNGSTIQDIALYNQIRYLHHQSEQPEDTLALENALLDFLLALVQRHSADRFTLGIYHDAPHAVKLARDYLEAHYAENISLSDLSDRVHISPYHLSRLFRKHWGIPPHKYLENVRIRHAEHLLNAGMPITDVAFETGFSSQSHLTRTFKHFIGTTPGEYLKQSKIV